VDSNDVKSTVPVQIRNLVVLCIENAVLACHVGGIRHVLRCIIARIFCQKNRQRFIPARKVIHRKVRLAVTIEVGDPMVWLKKMGLLVRVGSTNWFFGRVLPTRSFSESEKEDKRNQGCPESRNHPWAAM